MSVNLGKFPLVANTTFMENVGGTGLGGVLLGNESGLTCQVTLVGANVQRTLYAGTVDYFQVPKNLSWSGNLTVVPTVTLTNAASYPGSFLHVDVIGPGENVNGFYPMAFPRLNNIGNVVNTAMGGSNSWQNDNNPVNTQVGEATQSGSPNSNVFLDNSGNFYVAQWFGGNYAKLLQVIAGAATAIKLAATGKLTEVLGNLQVDDTGDNYLNGSSWFGGLSHVAAQAVIHASGSAEFGGVVQLDAGLTLPVGSLSRIAAVKAQALSNGKTVVTHALAVTPDLVILVQNSSGPGVLNAGYNPATLTGTTVDVWCNGLGNFDVICLKF